MNFICESVYVYVNVYEREEKINFGGRKSIKVFRSESRF